jgi:hypothetical protein
MFCPADLAGPKLRALRAAGFSLLGAAAIGESLARIDGLSQGTDQAPQASWFFIAGLSAAMKKRQALLRDLCASVVKGAFGDRFSIGIRTCHLRVSPA